MLDLGFEVHVGVFQVGRRQARELQAEEAAQMGKRAGSGCSVSGNTGLRQRPL